MATLSNTVINDTGFLHLPKGTTAQRPGTPVSGMMRFNTDLNCSEFYNGTAWIQISGGLVIESKTGSFTLSSVDNNKLFFINSASSVTVTVPNLAIGFTCQFIQTGAGTITMTGSGTTLNSASGLSTRTTNSVIGLVMNSSTTGYVFGDTIY